MEIKITIIYSNNSSKILNKVNHIKDILNQNANILINLISFDIFEKINGVTSDVYIVIINEVEKLLLCKQYIKNPNKMLIITERTDTCFILNCIETTKNLLYIDTDVNKILKKVFDICLENN